MTGNKCLVIKVIALLFFVFAGSNITLAQDSQSFYYENEFDLSFAVKNKWSMDIGIGNRGMFQERFNGSRINGYQHEHIEINHFTNYEAKNNLILSLGIRYRFRELFDAFKTDETRVIEQVEFETGSSSLGISHRFRLEQRFRENTIHRLRYALQFSRPYNEVFTLGAGTEALFAASPKLQPEAEQRLSISIENTSFENLEFGLSFEYRLENYFRNPGHEFFIITGVELSL